ncbi:unnamed protein product [Rangifer tarandus platyrhynchus]|uniref:Uncharacterized protein n=1 Tax=Rangifer tarandus platyrhynchus TaxID=3082113 RepID=A0AC59ZZ26_RANTA
MWVPGGQRPLRAQWGAAVGPRAPSAGLIRNCGPGPLTAEGPPAQDPHLLATCGELAPPPHFEPANPKMALLTLRPSSSVSERLGLALGDLPRPLRSRHFLPHHSHRPPWGSLLSRTQQSTAQLGPVNLVLSTVRQPS